jgi:hypothetical protein
MSHLQDIEYAVVLLFPGFGEERDNAEQIIEEALQHLNTEKDEPGMRFAQNVFARLEIVTHVLDAETRLRDDEDLAMMILHDLPQEEMNELTRECVAKNVPVCQTVDVPEDSLPERRPRRKDRGWKIVFSQRTDDKPPAHTIAGLTLTGSLDVDPEELGDRIGQLIAVMALGVMEHHWRRVESGA